MQLTEDDNIPKIIRELKKLDSKTIEVGVFGEDDSFLAMIATVNEFGARIRPKVARHLTIPLMKKYRGKNPRDFDLFFLETKEGHKFLVREKGKDQLEFAYMLADEVNIPERSFLRSTFDNKENEWFELAMKQLDKILHGEQDAQGACETLGKKMASDIQRTMRDIHTPPNANITQGAKGSSNPLIDTGRLRQSVTWKVRG